MIALPLNGLALRLIGLKRSQHLLSRLARIDEAGVEALPESLLDRVDQVARLVRAAASRGPYRGSCLQQSLTLWWLLRRQKIESDIRFGARRDDRRFEAHAWVEFRGIALNEEPEEHNTFAPFKRPLIHNRLHSR